MKQFAAKRHVLRVSAHRLKKGAGLILWHGIVPTVACMKRYLRAL